MSVPLNIDVGDAGDIVPSNTSHEEFSISSTDKYALFYNMQHRYRGKALIFNHKDFKMGLSSRNGTELDCSKLEVSLSKLGFDVESFLDLTLKELNTTLDYWTCVDYSDYDCFIIVVLTHGDDNIIFAKDIPYKPEYNLWGRFTGDKCPTLASKPKLFFIQACRGNRFDDGIQLITQTDQVDGNFSYKMPVYADILIAYSTIPGFYSWRDPEQGSWFIQYLCETLDKYGYELDLLTILTFVNRQIAIKCESDVPDNPFMHQKKQIICITSMLTRLIKFEKKN